MSNHELYVYFGKERRVASCLMVDDSGELLARGLAFCSFKDMPNRKRGAVNRERTSVEGTGKRFV